MSKCTCVYATADNTDSVRKGYELGGYLKEQCAACREEEMRIDLLVEEVTPRNFGQPFFGSAAIYRNDP